MSFYYLLFGHILGDFTLQTDKIARYKISDKRWNLLHTSIVTACVLLFSIPFGTRVIVLVIASGVLHYFIDLYKSRLGVRNPLQALIYFLADQALHIGIIYFISTFAEADARLLIIPDEAIKIMLILIIILSFSCILIQYVLRLLFTPAGDSFFVDNERSMGNLTRLYAFSALYFSSDISPLFLAVLPVIGAVLTAYYRARWRKVMSTGYFITRLLIDFAVSCAAYYFLSIM